MDVDERNRLHNRLIEVLGRREARTLMNVVPDQAMATKADLKGSITGLRADLGEQIADLRVEMHRGFRNQTIALTTMVALFNGVTLAVLKFG